MTNLEQTTRINKKLKINNNIDLPIGTIRLIGIFSGAFFINRNEHIIFPCKICKSIQDSFTYFIINYKKHKHSTTQQQYLSNT